MCVCFPFATIDVRIWPSRRGSEGTSLQESLESFDSNSNLKLGPSLESLDGPGSGGKISTSLTSGVAETGPTFRLGPVSGLRVGWVSGRLCSVTPVCCRRGIGRNDETSGTLDLLWGLILKVILLDVSTKVKFPRQLVVKVLNEPLLLVDPVNTF